ncbi:NSFL1 cofactor p47 [Caerostris darwini]|uniref:NSFL1 cofactor p47 n=1 Tax=Caerostris darwini TaxID=1538125 RepID=A0AAV4NKF6_9ARAC|nr:NSFL1 cofactor p47 [Caerostris darwini]
MADSEHSELIEEFCKVTGTDVSRARLYLEANGWDNNLAMSSYFEEAEEEPESDITEPSFPRPGSPKPVFASNSSSRIATFSSLANQEPENGDEGQAFYAGGSERSGQQVLGPGKRKAAGNEVVEAMFKAVRQFGGEVLDSASKRCSTTKLKAFKGAGYVLGNTEGTSDAIPSTSDEDNTPREVEVSLQLWQTGFTVDGGPLRDYNTPENKTFLEAIRKGEIPSELVSKNSNAEIHLSIEDHTHEEYVPKKPVVRAFSGTGFRLGNITPAVTEIQPGEKNDAGAQESLNVDESKPITSVQIRLADGSRLMMKANSSHTVGDIRRFIVIARPEYSASVFSLMTAFPTKELANDEATLEAENLLNAVVVQKLK